MPIYLHPQPHETELNQFIVLSDNWKEEDDDPAMTVGRIIYHPDYEYIEFHPDLSWTNEGLYPLESLACDRKELTVFLEMKTGVEVRSVYSRKLYQLLEMILKLRGV
jgi:hypothetical protein